MSEAIEKLLREAYRRGYADGWKDALDTGARLLNDIAKRQEVADATRWTNARDKWWERNETVNAERSEDERTD